MDALRLEWHRQFGASSEKMSDDLANQLSFLFNEAETHKDFVQAEEASETPVAAHKRHKKHEYSLDNLPEGTPRTQVHHYLEGEKLTCPNCGETMSEIGTEVVRTLELTPAKVAVKEHIYHTYACQKCSKECTETPVVKVPREKNVIPGSNCANHDPQIYHGLPSLPAGTGIKTHGHPSQSSDYVQSGFKCF